MGRAFLREVGPRLGHGNFLISSRGASGGVSGPIQKCEGLLDFSIFDVSTYRAIRCGDFLKTCMGTIHSLCHDGLITSDGSCDGVAKGSCRASSSKSCFCAGPKVALKLPKIVVPQMPEEAVRAKELAERRTASIRNRTAHMKQMMNRKQVQQHGARRKVGH